MSHFRVKTTYQEQGAYGAMETKTLYCWHSNTSDTVSFYNEKGECIMCVEDTVENNLLDAINRVYSPFKDMNNTLEEGVEWMDAEDRKIIGH